MGSNTQGGQPSIFTLVGTAAVIYAALAFFDNSSSSPRIAR
jgi:hypothetical protein